MKHVAVIGKLDFKTGKITYKGLFRYSAYRAYHGLKSRLYGFIYRLTV